MNAPLEEVPQTFVAVSTRHGARVEQQHGHHLERARVRLEEKGGRVNATQSVHCYLRSNVESTRRRSRIVDNLTVTCRGLISTGVGAGGIHTDRVRWETEELVNGRPELAWLRQRVRLAARGAPQCVLVVGPVGVGKTRLAAGLVAGVQREGFLSLVGRGYDDVVVPFLPFRETSFPNSHGASRRRIGDPGTCWPSRRGEDIAGYTDEQDQIASTRLVLELTDLLFVAAARTPLLLFLDDVTSSTPPHSPCSVTSCTGSRRHPRHHCSSSRRRGRSRCSSPCGVSRIVRSSSSRGSTSSRPRRPSAGARARNHSPWGWSRRTATRSSSNRSCTTERPQGRRPLCCATRRSSSANGGRCCLRSVSVVLELVAALVPDLSIDVLVRLGRWDEDTIVVAIDEAAMAGVLADDAGDLRFALPLAQALLRVRRLGPMAQARARRHRGRCPRAPRGCRAARSRVRSRARGTGGGSRGGRRTGALLGTAPGPCVRGKSCAWLLEAAVVNEERLVCARVAAEQAALYLVAGKCHQFASTPTAAAGSSNGPPRSAGRRVISRAKHAAKNERLVCLTVAGSVRGRVTRTWSTGSLSSSSRAHPSSRPRS